MHVRKSWLIELNNIRVVISSFVPHRRYEVRGGTRSAGSLITCGRENVRFSTEIAVYLGNGRPTVTMDTTNRKLVCDRSASFPVTRGGAGNF